MKEQLNIDTWVHMIAYMVDHSSGKYIQIESFVDQPEKANEFFWDRVEFVTGQTRKDFEDNIDYGIDASEKAGLPVQFRVRLVRSSLSFDLSKE